MIYKVDFIVQIHSLLNGQVTAKNMTKYGFSLTYFSEVQNLQLCPYTGKYESEKTHVLAYFTQ